MRRLPTKEEFNELIEKCKWIWTNNKTKGYKIIGPNGNSIFLPATGYSGDSLMNDVDAYGYYWSLSSKELNPIRAYSLFFNSIDINPNFYDFRDYSYSVRLVSNDEGIDLGLSVKWLPCNEGANKPEDFGNYYTYDEAVEHNIIK